VIGRFQGLRATPHSRLQVSGMKQSSGAEIWACSTAPAAARSAADLEASLVLLRHCRVPDSEKRLSAHHQPVYDRPQQVTIVISHGRMHERIYLALRHGRALFRRAWWQPILKMAFDDPEQEPPFWLATNNAVLSTPFPGIQIKAFAEVGRSRIGVFLSGPRRANV
jgi:hypothetical protein